MFTNVTLSRKDDSRILHKAISNHDNQLVHNHTHTQSLDNQFVAMYTTKMTSPLIQSFCLLKLMHLIMLCTSQLTFLSSFESVSVTISSLWGLLWTFSTFIGEKPRTTSTPLTSKFSNTKLASSLHLERKKRKHQKKNINDKSPTKWINSLIEGWLTNYTLRHI